MTAPRTCRSCGAELAPDVRWCTLCYAPITGYAARERLHDGFVGTLQPDIRILAMEGRTAFVRIGRPILRVDTAGRYVLVVVGVMLALGAFIAWIADI